MVNCLVVLVLLTSLVVALNPAMADSSICPDIPPVLRIESANFYLDQKGSIPDEAVEQDNEKLSTNLTNLYGLLHYATDISKSGKNKALLLCASALMHRWASAEALLDPPQEANSRVQRVVVSVALNLYALKLERAGIQNTPVVIGWLGRLTKAVTRDYHRDALKSTPYFRNNIYFWSGVAAGSFAILARDPAYAAYADLTWRDAIDQIGSDGVLAVELHRGRRALIYHQYAFSALLLLRELRHALEFESSSADLVKVHDLGRAIGRALCDASWMATRAGVANQEHPGAWGFRLASVLGLDIVDDNWHRCGTVLKNPIELRIGGDVAATQRAIRESNLSRRR